MGSSVNEAPPASVRLTLAIATCGRVDALERCLAAVQAQTRAPDEIIIVDQAASDEVRVAIRGSRLLIRYFEQPRLGLSASRNLALAKATGDVLAVTDDDCFPDREWAAAVTKAMEADPSLTGVTGPVLHPEGPPPAHRCETSSRPSLKTRIYAGRTIPWVVGSGGNFAMRVEDLCKIGGWDERLGVGTKGMAGEDCDIIDRLLAVGGVIRYDGGAIMRHEWQTFEKRKATRWSYGFGIGALCGIRLSGRDAHGLRMLVAYAHMKLREIRSEIRNQNWHGARERLTSLSALVPGCLYGLRAPSSSRLHGDT